MIIGCLLFCLSVRSQLAGKFGKHAQTQIVHEYVVPTQTHTHKNDRQSPRLPRETERECSRCLTTHKHTHTHNMRNVRTECERFTYPAPAIVKILVQSCLRVSAALARYIYLRLYTLAGPVRACACDDIYFENMNAPARLARVSV